MDDPAGVRSVESRRRLLEPRERPPGRLRAVLSNALLERAAGEVLHHDERPPLPLADVEDRHGPGLARKPRRGQALALEPLPDAGIRRVAVGEQLDDDLPAENLVGRGVDVAHRSASDQARRAVPRGQNLRLHSHRDRIPADPPSRNSWKQVVRNKESSRGVRYPPCLWLAAGPTGSSRAADTEAEWSANSQHPFSPLSGSPFRLPMRRNPSSRRRAPRMRRDGRRCRRSSSSATAGATASGSPSTARTATRCTDGRSTRSSATTSRRRRSATRRRRASGSCSHPPRGGWSCRRRSPFWLRDGAGKKHKLLAGSYAFGPGLKIKLRPTKPARKLRPPLLFSPGAAPLALGGRGYRGALRVKPAGRGLQVVNTVGLDSYLRGVVPSEMPNRWPAEALAAQAIVARTYALAHLHGGDFDVYSDTRSQVYGGIAAEAASSDDAVAETAGQVVLYDGELADTFFFSSSGGRTANVQDVWGGAAVPYLVSVVRPVRHALAVPQLGTAPIRFDAARPEVAGPGQDRRLPRERGAIRTGAHRDARRDPRAADGDRRGGSLGARPPLDLVPARSAEPDRADEDRCLRLCRATGRGRARHVQRHARGTPLRRLVAVCRPRERRERRGHGHGPPAADDGLPASERRLPQRPVRVSVSPAVDLSAGSDFASVSGQVHPVLAGASVEIQRLQGSTWVTVASTTTNSNGAFAATLNLSPGSYRARVTAGHGWAVGISETLTVVAP